MNAIIYKGIFHYIKNNELWLGCSLHGVKCSFIVPKEYDGKNVYIENGIRYGKVNNAVWFTNISNKKQNTPLDLYKKYNPVEYPKYDNYDAIECGKVADIPMDYDGVIGVPITFLDKYCPEQFDIIGITSSTDRNEDIEKIRTDAKHRHAGIINGKEKYSRILILKKN